jgi:flagellar hook protein FlgE
MGIFDALTTAVSGMQAQSFALQNISGNIANSQTTAYKRTDTAFEDLIPDQPPRLQTSGSVAAFSDATNNVQGTIQTASVGTFMAINGDGFFVVQKPSSFVDGRPVFNGVDQYTRRGDFQKDKDGFLVNGAGYYLLGIPVDATTGNLVGSVPQPLEFQNDFLPAQPTTQIQYRANLASYPFTANHDVNVPKSELINPANYSANPLAIPPQAAKITGTGAALLPDAVAVVTGTAILPATTANAGTFSINGQAINLAAGRTPTQVRDDINAAAPPGVTASLDANNHLVLTSANADTAVAITGAAPALFTELGIVPGTTNPTNLLTQSAAAAGQTMTITIGANPPFTVNFGPGALPTVSTLADLATRLGQLPAAAGSATVDPNGNITITAASLTDTITVTGTANPLKFGMHTTTGLPSNQTVVASDVPTFLKETVGGGAITAYDSSGAPVNIQMRWGKVDSTKYGGTDTWNLFYQVNSNATGTQAAWQNVGVNYTFGANGQLNPAVPSVQLNNVVVDGVALGNLTLTHGGGGLTQFADPNGNVQVNQLSQNGFPAGELQSVSVNDKGRVVGQYSNGRSIDLAEITLANFNGPNMLKRLDGGAFAATDESGPAILGAPGKIAGASLEASNTDIADEFSKLIITQQAYSANTRIITTGNQMVQDLLNMIR